MFFVFVVNSCASCFCCCYCCCRYCIKIALKVAAAATAAAAACVRRLRFHNSRSGSAGTTHTETSERHRTQQHDEHKIKKKHVNVVENCFFFSSPCCLSFCCCSSLVCWKRNRKKFKHSCCTQLTPKKIYIILFNTFNLHQNPLLLFLSLHDK